MLAILDVTLHVRVQIVVVVFQIPCKKLLRRSASFSFPAAFLLHEASAASLLAPSDLKSSSHHFAKASHRLPIAAARSLRGEPHITQACACVPSLGPSVEIGQKAAFVSVYEVVVEIEPVSQ